MQYDDLFSAVSWYHACFDVVVISNKAVYYFPQLIRVELEEIAKACCWEELKTPIYLNGFLSSRGMTIQDLCHLKFNHLCQNC